MKLRELIQHELNESTTELERALKKVREMIRKPNSGVVGEGKKTCEKIIDTLLASVDDRATFERYYDKFMADNVDAMDFVLEELYDYMKVKTAEEFFDKAFGVSEARVLGQGMSKQALAAEKESQLNEGLKSKTLLFKSLDEFFKTDEYSKKKLKAKGISDETYGRDSRIYIEAGSKRRELESFLSRNRYKVNTDYYPGSNVVEVSVAYFKGINWDE